MGIKLDIINLINLLLSVINLFLSYFILFNKNVPKYGKLFSLLIFFVFLWTIAILFYRLNIGGNLYLITKILYFIAIFLPYIFYLFVKKFSNQNLKLKNKILLILFTIFLIIITLFSDLIIQDVYTRISLENKIIFGRGFFLYVSYQIIIFLMAFYNMIIYYRGLKEGLYKKQYLFIIIGSIISSSIALTTNLILPSFGIFALNWFGQSGAILLVLFTLYAILKYHLFEIKIIISQILIIILTLSLFIYILLSKDYLELLVSIILFILFIMVAFRLSKVIKNSIQRSKDLEKTTKILSKNIESKDIFLRMTSHQLRTPITSLNGLIIMTLENWDTKNKMNDVARKDILLVYLNIQRLAEIVNDVLAVNAINADRFGISIREKVDIEDELKFMIEEKTYFVEYYDVKIYLNIKKGKDFHIIVDMMKIKSVFTNILNNAIFYGKGKVWINLYDLEENIKIEFIDNGIGIEAKDLERIWHKSYRSKRALYINPNGSGLGLFTSKVIVNLHKGSIIAESKGADKGSKFTIILPKTQK